MKIKSLLAAVSMVALTAGSASALTIPVTPAMGAAPMNAIAPSGVIIANELELPLENLGNVTFSIQTESGNYPSGNNFIVNITLPDGVEINGPITGSVLDSVTLRDAAGVATSTDTGSAVVQNQTGSTLQLFVSIDQTGQYNSLDFTLPLSLASCTVSSTLSVTVATESGTNVEDGVATAPSPVGGCASAFDTTFETDIVAGANDTVIALDDYETLRNDPGAALTATSTIGLFSATRNPMVFTNLSGGMINNANVLRTAFRVRFDDVTEINTVMINGVSGTRNAANNFFGFRLPFTGDVIDAPIDITVDGTDTIVSQDTSVSNVVHTFNDAGGRDLIDSETGAGGTLDALQREGKAFGFFDWNSGQAGGQRVNVYRITGLTAGSTVPYTITIENAGLTGTANTVRGTVTADGAGEAVLTDVEIAAQLPADVKRFDFGINLETGNNLDIDRLMSTGGIVSTYGDNANNTTFFNVATPDFDADDFDRSE